MSVPAISPTVRAILSTNIDLPADDVIRKAKDRGVTASESSIRYSVHNIRSEMKKKAKKTTPTVAPAAARTTKAPKPAHASTAVSAPTPVLDLSSMLANVALVNAVVGVCGGVEQARQAAEAVRACGSVEAFLQHLDLVATLRGGASA